MKHKNWLSTIKNFFGLEKRTKYIADYFDNSNIRSSIYVSSVVVILELYMIANITIRQLSAETMRSTQWYVTHLTCFVVYT